MIFIKNDFEKYIKENSNKVPPDKRKQENENIVIFRKIKADINLNNQISKHPPSELEEKKSEKIEKVDLDKASDQLISATKEIKNLFESKYELNIASYKDASLEIVNLSNKIGKILKMINAKMKIKNFN